MFGFWIWGWVKLILLEDRSYLKKIIAQTIWNLSFSCELVRLTPFMVSHIFPWSEDETPRNHPGRTLQVPKVSSPKLHEKSRRDLGSDLVFSCPPKRVVHWCWRSTRALGTWAWGQVSEMSCLDPSTCAYILTNVWYVYVLSLDRSSHILKEKWSAWCQGKTICINERTLAFQCRILKRNQIFMQFIASQRCIFAGW